MTSRKYATKPHTQVPKDLTSRPKSLDPETLRLRILEEQWLVARLTGDFSTHPWVGIQVIHV